MATLWRILAIAALLLGLWSLRRALQRRQLPPPPWRLPAAALVLELLSAPLAALGPSGLLPLLTQLLGGYALLALLGWAVLQLPAALGIGRPMPQILRDLLLLLLAGGLTVLLLQRAGLNLVGLVTTSAVLTAVIGLAAQETLKDLFGGLSMQIAAPFQVGDWVDLGQQRGRVVSITLMNTVLRGLDGADLVIPNSQASAAGVRRFAPQNPMGTAVHLGLAYDHPPAQALELLLTVASQHPDVLAEPAPQAWIEAYGESTINYQLLVFQPGTGDVIRLRSQLLVQIWYALERSGRQVPFPVLELRRPETREASDEPSISMRAELLAANPLLTCLNPDELATLAPLTRCLRFGPGETVVREGERGDSLYQLVSGRVGVWKANSGDGSAAIPVAELTAGAVFGEMTLCLDAPRQATVRSLEETLLMEVERGDLAPLLVANPALLEQLEQLVSQRQQQLTDLSDAATAAQRRSLRAVMRQLFSGLGVR